MLRLAAEPKRGNQRDRTAVAFFGLEPGPAQQVPRDHTMHHLQHRRDPFGLHGQQQPQRDRQRQYPLAHRHVRDDAVDQVRCRLRHAPRTARGAKAAALAAERQQLVVAALAAAQPQETMRQDSALQEGFELVLDEPGQLGARAGLGVGDEAGRVLLHQAVQRGLLGAVALITERAVGGFAPSWQRESGHGAASKYCANTQYLGATVSDGEVDRRDAGKLPVITVSSWPTAGTAAPTACARVLRCAPQRAG